ncbi:MAG: glycosyltransferase family 4 protein [Nibricoccus sp.]
MRVAFLTNQFLDPRKPTSWSGLPYFTRRALEDAGVETLLIDCEESHQLEYWSRFFYWKLLRRKRYLRNCNKALLRGYGEQIARKLTDGPPVEAVFSLSTWLLAYLETDLPVLLHTDGCFGALLGFYESFSNLAPPSIRDGHEVERLALNRCTRIAYSSHWAARAAQEFYKVDAAKIDVVFYGAGLHEPPDAEAVARSIRERDLTVCELLLVGVDWVRKGAEIAVQTAVALQDLGCDVRLTIVGCAPPKTTTLPPCVEVIPFIDKGTAEGRRRLNDLYMRSHFFILPSRAEASAVVFSEASAYGLPSLAADVGGLSSIILNDVNGRLFSLAEDGRAYANYLLELIGNPARYRALAARSLGEFRTRLSWKVSGQKLATILGEMTAPRTRPMLPDKLTARA